MTCSSPKFTIATAPTRCDNRGVFASPRPPGANPGALCEAEAWRSADTLPQVPDDLDPFPLARFENRAFNDESTSA
jgi:hypothetical protein